MAAPKSLSKSLNLLKRNGYTAHSVERYNSFVKIRQDFGGFADILAYKPGEFGVLAVQACMGNGDVSKHLKKYSMNKNMRTWIESGNRFEIWSWAKRGDRGKRKVWSMVSKKILLEQI